MLYVKLRSLEKTLLPHLQTTKRANFDVFVEVGQYNNIVLLLLEDNFLESNTGN